MQLNEAIGRRRTRMMEIEFYVVARRDDQYTRCSSMTILSAKPNASRMTIKLIRLHVVASDVMLSVLCMLHVI